VIPADFILFKQSRHADILSMAAFQQKELDLRRKRKSKIP
jgi:hypothetical protein